jgi:hypothetical protein
VHFSNLAISEVLPYCDVKRFLSAERQTFSPELLIQPIDC